MSSLSNALRQIQLPPEVDAQLLTAAADEIERLEASRAADHQNTIRMITSLRDIFRDEKAAWQAEREKSDKALGEVIDQRDEYHDMADRLAHAIADYFLAPIGEHSSASCPWMRALEIIENGEPQGGEDVQPVAWMKDDGTDAWTDAKKNGALLYAGSPGAYVASRYSLPLYATPQPAGRDAREVPSRERLIDIIIDHLTATYVCNRVWEAWHVGTMSKDDFESASETDLPNDLADAIIAALTSSGGAA